MLSPAGVHGVVEEGLLLGLLGLLLLLLHELDVRAEDVVGGLGELILGAEVVELAVEPAVRGRVTVLSADLALGKVPHGPDGFDELLVSLGRNVILDLAELFELAIEDRGELVGEGLGVLGSELGNFKGVVLFELGNGLLSLLATSLGLLDEGIVVSEPVGLAQGDDVRDVAQGEELLASVVRGGLDGVLGAFENLLEHGSCVERGVCEGVI